MDATRFDRLAKALAAAGTRRGVLNLLGSLPLVGGLGAWVAGEATPGVGARKRHKRRRRRHRKHHKKNNKKHCQPESPAETCAGKCGEVLNDCNDPVDCGSCVCDPSCPVCQSCDETTGVCVPNPDMAGADCDDGDACTSGTTCSDGACGGGAPVVCPATECQDPGACDPETGCAPPTNKPAGTPCTSAECGACDGAGTCVSGTHCGSGEEAICCGPGTSCCDTTDGPACCENATQVCYQSVCATRCSGPSDCPPGATDCSQVVVGGSAVNICRCAFEGTCPCFRNPSDTCPQGSVCNPEDCGSRGGGCYEICAAT